MKLRLARRWALAAMVCMACGSATTAAWASEDAPAHELDEEYDAFHARTGGSWGRRW